MEINCNYKLKLNLVHKSKYHHHLHLKEIKNCYISLFHVIRELQLKFKLLELIESTLCNNNNNNEKCNNNNKKCNCNC